MSRGGSFSVSLSGAEYDLLDKLAEETGLTKSRVMKMALAHFAQTSAVRIMRKDRANDERKGE